MATKYSSNLSLTLQQNQRQNKKRKTDKQPHFEGEIFYLISGRLLYPEINVLCVILNINAENEIVSLVKGYLQKTETQEELVKRSRICIENACSHMLKTRGYIDYSLLFFFKG